MPAHLSGGLQWLVKGKTMQKLYVIADPVLKGLHPLHDSRYVTTGMKTHLTETVCGPGWEFEDPTAAIIASMTDCENQAEYARAFAASPELLEACMRVVSRFCYLAKKEDAGHEINWREMGANGEIAYARSAIQRALGREQFTAFALAMGAQQVR